MKMSQWPILEDYWQTLILIKLNAKKGSLLEEEKIISVRFLIYFILSE
jgi:hypothetical protein